MIAPLNSLPRPVHDTIDECTEAHPGASFRVYTPGELRNVAMRPSIRPLPEVGLADELRESLAHARAAPPGTILKWVGIAFGVTMLFLTVVLGLANMTDDTAVASKGYTSVTTNEEKVTTKKVPVVETPSLPPSLPSPPSPPASVQPSEVDFELPDDSPLIERTAAKRRGPSKTRRAIGNSVTFRDAPY